MKKYTLLILIISISANIFAQTTGYIPITDPAYKIPYTATIATTPGGGIPQWYLNLEKYWYYRYKLVNDFMLIGVREGQSIPAQHRDLQDLGSAWNVPHSGARNMIEWQDATIDLGHYLSTLALEYKLLSNSNWDISRTDSELKYAQNAVDRLRLNATQYYNNPNKYPGNLSLGGYQTTAIITSTDGGFCLRDDVPFIDFIDQGANLANWRHFNRLGINPTQDPLAEKAATYVYGAFTDSYGGSTGTIGPLGKRYTSSNPRSPDVPDCESQDQLCEIFTGEALISKYIPNTDVVQSRAKDAIFNLIDWPRQFVLPMRPYKSIPSPDRGMCLKEDCSQTGILLPSAAPMTNAAFHYGSHPSQMKTDEVIASPQFGIFEILQYLDLNPKIVVAGKTYSTTDIAFPDTYAAFAKDYTLYAPGDVISDYIAFLAKKPNTTWNTLKRHANDDHFGSPHLPLIYELVQNENHNWDGHNAISAMLDNAPPCGPYAYSGSTRMYGSQTLYSLNSNMGDYYNVSGQAYYNIEWSGNDRLAEPYHRLGYDEYDRVNGKNDAEFNGLDYMMLFNLFALQQSTTSTPYLQGMMDSYYCTNYDVDYPDANSYGEGDQKLKLNWLEYVSAMDHIKYSSDPNKNGWLDFRGGKVIDLLPGGIHGGFQVDAGAFFQAYILDYNCNGGDYGNGIYHFAILNPDPSSYSSYITMPGHDTGSIKSTGPTDIPIAYLPKGLGIKSERAPDVDPAEDEAIEAMFTQSFKDSMITAYKHYFANNADGDQLDYLQNTFGWTKDSLDKYKDDNYADTSLVTLYPNPTHESTTLEYTVTAPQHVYITLTNNLGQQMNNIIDNYAQNATPDTYKVLLHSERLRPGVYYCTIFLNGTLVCKKLVVD